MFDKIDLAGCFQRGQLQPKRGKVNFIFEIFPFHFDLTNKLV